MQLAGPVEREHRRELALEHDDLVAVLEQQLVLTHEAAEPRREEGPLGQRPLHADVQPTLMKLEHE